MLASGLGVALTPVPLLLAAAILTLWWPRFGRWSRMVGAVAIALSLALLAVAAAVVAGGGRVQATLGMQVGGFTLRLRSDPIGVVIALAAVGAALFALADRRLRPDHTASLLACAAGAVIAALAGDLVTLFGGSEIATLAIFSMACGTRRRLRRGSVVAVAVLQLSSMGLLAAAVQLQTSQGTEVFAAIPSGALTAGIAWPWAAAAAAELLATAVVPLRGSDLATGTWAACGAVPAGAAILLRLREAAGGASLPLSVVVLFAAVGGLAACFGGAVALSRNVNPAAAGRGLAIAAAAPVVALLGFGSAASAGLATGLCALFLCVALSGAWERPAFPLRRWLAPAGLLAAGGLPLGLGATALVLELGGVAVLGRAGTALLFALLIGAAAAASAALFAAWTAHRLQTPSNEAPPVLPVAALVAGAAAALFPGGFAALFLPILAGSSLVRTVGAATVLGPGGGWPGGYFLLAGVFLAVMLLAAASVFDLRLPRISAQPGGETLPLPVPIAARRRLRGPLRAGSWLVVQVDGWLMVQPQLPLLISGSVLALVLVH